MSFGSSTGTNIVGETYTSNDARGSMDSIQFSPVGITRKCLRCLLLIVRYTMLAFLSVGKRSIFRRYISSSHVFSKRVLSDTSRQADTILLIERSKWVLMTILSFLAAFCDGFVSQSVWRDPHLSNFYVIVPL